MPDAQTLAVYAAKVEDYAAFPISETQERSLARFLEGLPAGASLLDLGCGPGRQAARMVAAGHSVSAIDAAPEFVEAARARGVAARVAGFDDLTEVQAYDGIWASFSLLHAPRYALPGYLSAIARALKPEGRLFLGMKLGQGEERDAMGRFYAYFSEEELRGHVEAAGLRVTHAETGAEVGLAGNLDPFLLIFADA
ncbi:MAG: class I SAM-dependent methyltransferase [Pseudomonadota bacterium]